MENDVILYCETCKFYENKKSNTTYHTQRDGLCRRYPRLPVGWGNSMYMVMCETNKQDWCGEFIQK